MTITSTDSAGAENNPEFALVRNSSSPADNDLLGTFFVFNGENDAAEETIYAIFQTRANDVSDGTEDGNMFFKVMTTVP